VKKIHDLIELLEETGLSRNKSITNFIEELNPYYIPTRYPEAGFRLKITYGKKNAGKILKATQEVFKWLRTELNHRR
jgi:HEPN domain-containing protein